MRSFNVMLANECKTNDGLSFSVTPYIGHERKVRKIINKNRDEEITLDYLNWRYQGGDGRLPPVVFWVYSNDGFCVGMSSLIFRAYWHENKKIYFAVSGDTSINEKYRGKGIGKKLFEFISEYLKKNRVFCSLGIGTPAAVGLLASVGWEKAAKLGSYAYVVEASEKLYERINQKIISKILGYSYAIFCKVRLSIINTKGYKLKRTDFFDDSFDKFWKNFDKNGIVLRDRSLSSLEWRYSKHPLDNFEIYKVLKCNKFVGFLVCKVEGSGVVCVYDLLVDGNEHCLPGLCLFIKDIFKKKDICIVRMDLVNESHFYSKVLKKIGFFKRSDEAFLQILLSDKSNVFHSNSLLITKSDKDI